MSNEQPIFTFGDYKHNQEAPKQNKNYTAVDAPWIFYAEKRKQDYKRAIEVLRDNKRWLGLDPNLPLNQQPKLGFQPKMSKKLGKPKTVKGFNKN